MLKLYILELVIIACLLVSCGQKGDLYLEKQNKRDVYILESNNENQ
jgi:predicted small lipoprotein YifL